MTKPNPHPGQPGARTEFRRLLHNPELTPPPDGEPRNPSDAVDFDVNAAELGVDTELREEIGRNGGGGIDEVDQLLRRYQAETAISNPGLGPRSQVMAARDLPLVRPAPAPTDTPVHRSVTPLSQRLTTHRQTTPPGELERLRAENDELRNMLGEMKHLLEAASALDPDLVEQQQREYQRMISERDEQILGLSEQIDAIQAELTKLKSIPRDEDLEQLANELEQERCQLTQERRQLEIDRKQLREDEDELMKQMREMEVGMARERAELARQKMEMSRLHAEIRLELEQLQRGDLTMKERLLQFQRRHQDVIGRPGGAPAPNPMVAPPAAAPMSAPPSRRDSVIRKIFGSGGGSS